MKMSYSYPGMRLSIHFSPVTPKTSIVPGDIMVKDQYMYFSRNIFNPQTLNPPDNR